MRRLLVMVLLAMVAGARGLARKVLITIAFGLGLGIIIGLVHGKLMAGLFVGVTLTLAFAISVSGLGSTSRDR